MAHTDRLAQECHDYDLDGEPLVRAPMHRGRGPLPVVYILKTGQRYAGWENGVQVTLGYMRQRDADTAVDRLFQARGEIAETARIMDGWSL